ncbi:MAG: hypothetical protein ACKVKQ_05910 [Flavobacteriales bacterium]|jgi:hypothetical protein|tara:strand:+ start:1819 stop:2073 length:255 start_codon:yes stop_codon:yes gene_type:complete
MKAIIKAIRTIVNNDYIKLLISFILLVIGIIEIYGDIISGELDFNHKHGFGIYGLLLFIDSLFSVFEGIIGISDGKGLFVKQKK